MRHARNVIVIAFLTGAAVSSCGGGDDFFMKGVLAPPAIDIHSTEACAYTVSGSSPLLSAGLVDAALAGEYTPTFLVGNSSGDRVALDSATVRLVDSTGTELLSFSTLAAASIDPGSKDAPSYAPYSFHLVDQHTLATMASRLGGPDTKVRIVAYATIYAGDAHSPELSFPVDVCNGCLVSFPPASQDPTKPAPNCAAPIAAGEMGTRPCVLGQDQVADCRLCQGDPACSP